MENLIENLGKLIGLIGVVFSAFVYFGRVYATKAETKTLKYELNELKQELKTSRNSQLQLTSRLDKLETLMETLVEQLKEIKEDIRSLSKIRGKKNV